MEDTLTFHGVNIYYMSTLCLCWCLLSFVFLYFAFCVVPFNVKDKNKKMIEIRRLHEQYEWPGGLMVSALDCGSRSLGSRPCRVIELCF